MLDSIKTWFLNLFVGKYLGSFVRTGLAALAGWLLKEGIIDDKSLVESLANNLELILAGLVTYLIAQGSSLVQKKLPEGKIVKKEETPTK